MSSSSQNLMNRKDRSRLFLRLSRQNHGNGNCKVKANSLLFFLCYVVSMSTAQSQKPPASTPPSNPFGPAGHKFNPLMAIVMVVLVTAFFFMGIFSVYIRQCNGRRTHRGNWDAAMNFGRWSRRLSRGLDPLVIDSFPTFLYSTVKGLKIGKDTLECAVCLNEFEDDETLRMIPKCSHVFHPDCIDTWLSSHSTCPVCRTNLTPKSGKSITCATVQVNDLGFEPENRPEYNNINDETSHIDVVNQARNIELPDVNLVNSNTANNQNRQQRSQSTGWRLTQLFPRSNSIGHSLVQLGENYDQFMLRLSEDVRSQLMNSSLSSTKSCVALLGARSSKKGYRSRSLGRNYFNYERFDLSDRWRFTMTPFFSRIGSVRSPKQLVGGGDATPSKGLSKSIKSPFDRLFIGGEENVRDRSSDRLRSESLV